MPTVKEKNAAFDAVKKKIDALEATMPSLIVGYAKEYLSTRVILDMIEAALVAAEKARAPTA